VFNSPAGLSVDSELSSDESPDPTDIPEMSGVLPKHVSVSTARLDAVEGVEGEKEGSDVAGGRGGDDGRGWDEGVVYGVVRAE